MRRGFFGKIPGHGDFIDRGLALDVKQLLDEWLQHGLATSRAAVGDWLNAYLTSPVWRFALGEGLCTVPWTGIMVPSVDRVGRYFPLVIAAELPRGTLPVQVVAAGAGWFESAEAAAFAALDHDHVDADALLDAVEQLGDVALGNAVLAAEPGGKHLDASALAMPFAWGTSPGHGLLALTHRLLEGRLGASYSLWWTLGSERVHPGIVACGALPAPDDFAAMLDDAAPAPGLLRLQGYGLLHEDAPAERTLAVEAPESLSAGPEFTASTDSGGSWPTVGAAQAPDDGPPVVDAAAVGDVPSDGEQPLQDPENDILAQLDKLTGERGS